MKKIGSILDVDYGIIVHQVNAQGVMGGGVAKVLRTRYPQMFEDYTKHVGLPYCQRNFGSDLMGDVIWTNLNSGLMIASIVGQQFFGREKKRYTSYDALDVGFSKVATMAMAKGLPVHYPLIGSDLGGGNWTIVSSIIDQNLGTIDHTLWVLPEASK